VHEPRPLKVKKSTLDDRVVRVGLVLYEDKKQHVELEVRSELNDANGNTFPPGAKYTVQAEGEVILLSDEKRKEILRTEELLLSPSIPTFPSPTLTLHTITAGRNFHWKKELSADFPGSFEIRAQEGFLELITTLPFEEYLACVVVSEMASGAPREFVKAQTVAARSWGDMLPQRETPW
jgi:hypothetical protein